MRVVLLTVVLPWCLFGELNRPQQAPRNGGAADTAQLDSLYFAARPDQALTVCERTIAAGEDGLELRWRAARAAIAIGMSIPESPRRKELYDDALTHARRGLELAPQSNEARYWVAAAAGRRAHRDDPLLSVRLAYEVFEQVTPILATDSLHAGAHHALGELHAEVMRAPRFVRFVAGRVLRMDLAQRANAIDAERHLRRAVELDAQVMMFLVDLADFYGRASRRAELDSVLARMTDAPLRHPMDRTIRDARLARWQPAAQSRR